MRATYDVVAVTVAEVVIRDTGHDTGRSVTNDAERVVADVAVRFPGRRIFYYDSQADYGELVHDRGVFRDFAAAAEGAP